jgi:hypothetical protein
MPAGGTLRVYGRLTLSDGAGISVWQNEQAEVILHRGGELIIRDGPDIRDSDNIRIEKKRKAKLRIEPFSE